MVEHGDRVTRSNYSALILLLVDVVVLPDRDAGYSKDKDGGGGNAAILLVVAPGIFDGIAGGTSDRVGLLREVATIVYGRVVGLGVIREGPQQSLREGVGVDGTSDSVPDGTANVGT